MQKNLTAVLVFKKERESLAELKTMFMIFRNNKEAPPGSINGVEKTDQFLRRKLC